MDISKCESCTEDCPQAHGRHESATGRMYAMRELAKCAPYWDSLFDENENPKITPDRLRELVEADRDGRCVVIPKDYDGTLFRIWKNEIISSERFAWTMKELGKTVFPSRKAAEEALKGKQNG